MNLYHKACLLHNTCITSCFQCRKWSLLSQCLVRTHFLFSRETRWDVGIPGVCTAFTALRGRLQSSHRQATSHQQENNTSWDQCEYREGTAHKQTGLPHIHNWQSKRMQALIFFSFCPCFVAVSVWETRNDSPWSSSPRHWERSHTNTKGDVQDQVFW